MKRIPLVDSRIVAQAFAMRREVVQPSARSDGPIIDRAQTYGSVLRDPEGLWRMWYLDDPVYCEYFATSRDGLAWEMPRLDLVSPRVRAQTAGPNAFLGPGQKDAKDRWLVERRGPEGFCVLDARITPHPAAKMRYTAMYLARFAGPVGRESGLCVAHSEDGVNWLADEASPVIPGWRDTSNVLL